MYVVIWKWVRPSMQAFSIVLFGCQIILLLRASMWALAILNLIRISQMYSTACQLLNTVAHVAQQIGRRDQKRRQALVLFVSSTQSFEAHSMSHFVSSPITITIVLSRTNSCSHRFHARATTWFKCHSISYLQLSFSILSDFIRALSVARSTDKFMLHLHIAYISCLFLHTFWKYLQLAWAFSGRRYRTHDDVAYEYEWMEHSDFRSNCENAIESHLEQLASARLTAVSSNALAMHPSHNTMHKIIQIKQQQQKWQLAIEKSSIRSDCLSLGTFTYTIIIVVSRSAHGENVCVRVSCWDWRVELLSHFVRFDVE